MIKYTISEYLHVWIYFYFKLHSGFMNSSEHLTHFIKKIQINLRYFICQRDLLRIYYLSAQGARKRVLRCKLYWQKEK